MATNERKLRLGFIGTGGFIRGNHLPNAHRNPSIEVRALCDLREDVLQDLESQYRPAYVTMDMREVCRDPDIDAVVIGTRETERVAPIRTAAEAGKHILIEKPMSVGTADTREIVDIVNRTGIFLMVGFNRPYSQPMQDVRQRLREVRGDETLIHYRLVGEAQLWPLVYQADVAAGRANSIVNEATHIFDLMNWLTEDYPKSIFVAGGEFDNHAIVMEYPRRTTVSILSGSCGTEAYPKERLEIFTNYTTIVMDSFVEVATAGQCDSGDRTYPLAVDPYAEQVAGDGGEALRRKRRLWYANIPPADRADGHYYTSRPSEDKGHYNELEYFRRCVTGRVMPETNHVRGAVATLTALSAIESLRARSFVDLDFSDYTGPSQAPNLKEGGGET